MSPFWSATLALSLAGLLGVIVLAVTMGGPILDRIPVANPLLKRLLLVVQPTILLVIFTVTGVATADIAGTRSLIAELAAGYPILAADVAPFAFAAVAGVVFGFALFLVDTLTRPIWSPDGRGPSLAADWRFGSFLAGLTYGGVTEEIMMRWGLMNLGLWLLVTLSEAAAPGHPSGTLVGVAIILSAMIFAVGHIPAAFAGGFSAPRFIARTLGLNFVAGLFFGWLFWRWNLETAMVAHAAFHVGGAVLAVGLRLGARRGAA